MTTLDCLITGIFCISSEGQTIALISFGLALMNALVRNAILDKEKLKQQKEKMKEHQTAIKQATKAGDTKKAQKAQEQMMSLTMEQMKHSFKPMIFTIIPFLFVFNWLRSEYDPVGTVATVFGFELSWFFWYIICSIVLSTILNKVLKLT